MCSTSRNAHFAFFPAPLGARRFALGQKVRLRSGRAIPVTPCSSADATPARSGSNIPCRVAATLHTMRSPCGAHALNGRRARGAGAPINRGRIDAGSQERALLSGGTARFGAMPVHQEADERNKTKQSRHGQVILTVLPPRLPAPCRQNMRTHPPQIIDRACKPQLRRHQDTHGEPGELAISSRCSSLELYTSHNVP